MKKIKIIANGIFFSLMLQLAVGPTCLYLLNVSISEGYFIALTGVIAVVIVDALYITLAILGIAKFLNRKRIKLFKVFGGMVLILFASKMIFCYFSFKILPQVQIASIFAGNNVFIYAGLLTLSNPLTIIFWSGIFTSKMLEDNYDKFNLILFSFGCLLTTFIFLSLVSGTGILIQRLLTENFIKITNLLIGIIIFAFGLKLLLSRIDNKQINSKKNLK